MAIWRRDIATFLDYLNGCHSRIRWNIEIEKEGKLPFDDLNVCRKAFWITAGIYRVSFIEIFHILVEQTKS
jgi:hypothetical protein